MKERVTLHVDRCDNICREDKMSRNKNKEQIQTVAIEKNREIQCERNTNDQIEDEFKCTCVHVCVKTHGHR